MSRAIAAGATMVLLACGSSADREASPAVAPTDAATRPAGIARYAALLANLGACAVDDRGIDRDCPGWIALDTLRANNAALFGRLSAGLAELGAQHIGDAAPAVRLHAARLLADGGPAHPQRTAQLAAAARVEPDPAVLAAMIRMVGAEIGRDDVRAMLLGHAGHDDARVRVEVVTALTAPAAADTAGTLERAVDMVTSDPSTEVRVRGCRGLGDRGDERALPVIEALTTAADTPDALFEGCFAAVVAMWCAPIVPDAPSRAAYEHTLALLSATPRDRTRPPWGPLRALTCAADPTLVERAPWIDPPALHAALAGVAGDSAADWMARTTAIDVLGAVAAPRRVLERLRQKVRPEARSHPGRLVAERIDEVLATP